VATASLRPSGESEAERLGGLHQQASLDAELLAHVLNLKLAKDLVKDKRVNKGRAAGEPACLSTLMTVR